MALNTQLSNYLVNVQANAGRTEFNSGFIDVYNGTQPATADTAITNQIRLVRLTLNATAFAAAANGVLTANAIASGSATQTGTATWFRIVKSDGTTVLMDGTAGASGSNLNLGSASITTGQTVTCSSFSHTLNKAVSGL